MNTNHAEAPSATAACAMVIFGATGDLTKRKLLPALLNLAQENVLPQHFAIIGVAGGGATTESFRKSLTAEIPQFAPDPIDLKMWDWLVERIYFVSGDFADPDTYKRLQAQLDSRQQSPRLQRQQFFLPRRRPALFRPHRPATWQRPE